MAFILPVTLWMDQLKVCDRTVQQVKKMMIPPECPFKAWSIAQFLRQRVI